MYIIHVFVHVKPAYREDFISASIENAKASVNEPGIAQFDILQDGEDPDRFVLIEVYRTKNDPASHKETGHYQRWKEGVEVMMAEPRTKKIYENIYPDEKGW